LLVSQLIDYVNWIELAGNWLLLRMLALFNGFK